MIDMWKQRARALKELVSALSYAYRDPRTPWRARVIIACVVGYALSPIDLIPDFIPILGYLDDLVLLPFGVLIAVRLVPAEVWADARARARAASGTTGPVNWIAASFIIIALWLGITIAAGILVCRWR